MVENRGQAKGYYIIAKVRQFSTTGWRDKSSNVKVVQIIVQKWLEKGWILLTSVGVSEYNGIAILPAGITKHRTFVARVTDNKIGTWEHGRSFKKASSFLFSHSHGEGCGIDTFYTFGG